jgi:nucleoside-diphosphate-sugar epimerase
MPRVSEHTTMALVRLGVRACVVRMPQFHSRAKQGFASYLLAHARQTGVSADIGAGSNRWPAVHRLDAAQLFRLVLERGETGLHCHAVAEEGVSTREIAEAIARRLDISAVSLPVEASAGHFGWLDRIARMDVPASSALTRERLRWHLKATPDFLSDIQSADGDSAWAAASD